MEPDSLREIVIAHTYLPYHECESNRFAGRGLQTFLYGGESLQLSPG